MAKTVAMMRSAGRLCRHANPWRGWQLKAYAARFLAQRLNVSGERIRTLSRCSGGDFKDPAAPINRSTP